MATARVKATAYLTTLLLRGSQTNVSDTKSAPGASLYFDALGRLAEYDTSISTRFYYDGANIAAEVANPSGAVLRRYVYGPGADEPLVWYEGSGAVDRRFPLADERGSIIAISNASGAVSQINAYDEFGIPQGKSPSGTPGSTATPSFGRFGYTGQAWLPEIGLYHYKARIYSPTLGRFLQSDPIGYGDGMNIYNYVGGDPVNYNDPSGLCATGERLVRSGGSRIGRCVAFSDGSAATGIGNIGQDSSSGGDRIIVVACGGGPRINGRCASASDLVSLQPTPSLGPVATPIAPQNAPPPCGSGGDGPVKFRGITNTTAGGLVGYTITEGVFTTASGGRGRFRSTGYAIGFDIGSSATYGTAANLDDFSGNSKNVSGSFSIRGIGPSATYSRSDSTGGSYGSGGGGPSFGFRTGASISQTDTEILSLNCPKK